MKIITVMAQKTYGISLLELIKQTGKSAGGRFQARLNEHVSKIIAALGLSGIGCTVNRWRFIPSKGSAELGAEIDMLIDRDDGAITVCEIKYCSTTYVVDKSYAKNLSNKLDVLTKHCNIKKPLFLVMITSNGFKQNLWTEDLVTTSVELKDLF
jgi:hypothetical protein